LFPIPKYSNKVIHGVKIQSVSRFVKFLIFEVAAYTIAIAMPQLVILTKIPQLLTNRTSISVACKDKWRILKHLPTTQHHYDQ
jgi:hypothetical protein